MKTLESFIEESNIPESLIHAVTEAVGDWEYFRDCVACDVSEHGASGGVGGFIYYSDTVPFAENNKEVIFTLCRDMASDFGVTTLAEFIAGFNCVNLSITEVEQVLMGDNPDDRVEVYNALAWFALEEVARSYIDLVESDD